MDAYMRMQEHGEFDQHPKNQQQKILAGFFCLNMPITDNGQY